MDRFARFISDKRSRPPKCAALFLMAAFLSAWILSPGRASAQLYVAQEGAGSVSEYAPISGAAINVNLITGLAGPGGIALSGNTLFVANSGVNRVGKYTVNATTVTEANPTFISAGLSTPISVAVSGSHLFVVNENGNQAISEYDANTGVLQKASFLPPSTTQVGGPIAVAVSGNYLFVAHYQESTNLANNFGLGSVGQYSLNSGAVVNERLIKGLAGPIALAVSGDTLYVVTSGYTAKGGVGTYDANTGAPLKPKLVTGLTGPQGIATLGTTVFVAIRASGLGSVATYDASTGDSLNANFITGLRSPYGLAVAPANPDSKDFNGSGYDDLVWENTATGERAIWILNDGVHSSSISLPTASLSWHIAGVGDFLGNGQSDLVFENTATGQHTIWILKEGVFQSSITLPVVSAPWHLVGAGDFNADGYADLVWQNTANGERVIWLLVNGVHSSNINLPTVAIQWNIVEH
jgi:hypothetical protein